MAYHLSVVEIIHEINQQDTPPSPKPRTPEMSITLNDDPAVQGIEITLEYLTAAPQACLTTGEIRQAQQNGLAVAFLFEQDRQRIREKVQRKRERA